MLKDNLKLINKNDCKWFYENITTLKLVYSCIPLRYGSIITFILTNNSTCTVLVKSIKKKIIKEYVDFFRELLT